MTRYSQRITQRAHSPIQAEGPFIQATIILPPLVSSEAELPFDVEPQQCQPHSSAIHQAASFAPASVFACAAASPRLNSFSHFRHHARNSATATRTVVQPQTHFFIFESPRGI